MAGTLLISYGTDKIIENKNKLHSNKPMPTTSKQRTFTRGNRIGNLRTWNTHEVGSNQTPSCKKNGYVCK